MIPIARTAIVFFVLLNQFLPQYAFGQNKKNEDPNAQQEVGQQDDVTLKIETNLVSIPVIVNTRNGNYVPDMQKEEFTVLEDEVKQEIAFFATITQPFHVILMLDTSASTEEKLGLIQQSAISFVEQLQSADRVKVISFDDEIRDLNEFTSDQVQLRRAIQKTKPGKGTRLYDAVHLAFNLLKPIKGRKAIVIFTDGVDYRSDTHRYFHNIRSLEESDVIVYPIRYDTREETERLARRQAQGPRIDPGTVLGGGDSSGSGGNSSPRGTTGTTFPGGSIPFPGGSTGGRGGIGGLPVPPVIISRRRSDPRDSRYPDRRDPEIGYPDRRDDPSDPKLPPTQPTGEDSISSMLDLLYKTADAYLKDLATKSGGKLVRVDTLMLLPSAFKEIAAELRTQYSIGYYPTNPVSKGGYRKIKVRTSRKGTVVRTRPGYVVTKSAG